MEYPNLHKPGTHSRPGLVQRGRGPPQTLPPPVLVVDTVPVLVLQSAWGIHLGEGERVCRWGREEGYVWTKVRKEEGRGRKESEGRRKLEGGRGELKGGREGERREGRGRRIPAFWAFMALMISCIRYHPSSASSGVFACSRGRRRQWKPTEDKLGEVIHWELIETNGGQTWWSDTLGDDWLN